MIVYNVCVLRTKGVFLDIFVASNSFRLVSCYGRQIIDNPIDFLTTGFIHLAILGVFIEVYKRYGATCEI